jgi:hypothetical protein
MEFGFPTLGPGPVAVFDRFETMKGQTRPVRLAGRQEDGAGHVITGRPEGCGGHPCRLRLNGWYRDLLGHITARRRSRGLAPNEFANGRLGAQGDGADDLNSEVEAGIFQHSPRERRFIELVELDDWHSSASGRVAFEQDVHPALHSLAQATRAGALHSKPACEGVPTPRNQRLYRSALKSALDWNIRRDLWRQKYGRRAPTHLGLSRWTEPSSYGSDSNATATSKILVH